MANPEVEGEEAFLRGYHKRSFTKTAQQPNTPPPSSKYQRTRTFSSQKVPPQQAVSVDKDDGFSTAISWPIILAVIPTLGAFVAGSAEVWSDFIMILLILYYVYKWITVPWSYYESARSRRMIHQYAAHNIPLDPKRRECSEKRKEAVEEELRRHELIGLVWVVISPGVAGYTLQYSRYFLSNYDKYMSTFNVTVFVLAATLKPLIHVMALLRERTLFLQSEMLVNESEIEILQKKLEFMEEELDGLRKAFATKRDLGQVANGLTPTIQNLSKAIKRFEKKETQLRSWSEDRFTEMEQKVQDFDQFICYSIEQDQKKSAQRILVTFMFLPINLTFWAAKRMTGLLPIPRALLGYTASSATKTRLTNYRPNSKHLTHPDIQASGEAEAAATTSSQQQQQQQQTYYNTKDGASGSGGEESTHQVPQYGHRPRS